jgi:hypothetical protein
MTLLVVRSIGPVAADLLEQASEVEVFALFERSFYLAVADGLVCVGEASIGDGPINVVLVPGVDLTGLPLSLEMAGQVRPREIGIEDVAVLSLAGAHPWRPPAWPAWDPTKARAGCALVREHLRADPPRQGLAALVIDPAREATSGEARAARPLVDALQRGAGALLADGRPGPELVRAATLLLGLGPGTTPSGDDLLAGFFLALGARGASEARDALWEAIAPEVAALTTEISAMHLATAADGLAAAALHAMACRILEGAGDGPGLEQAIGAATAIGHTSGWDALAGLLAGLEALPAA